MNSKTVSDVRGTPVTVGTRVRVISPPFGVIDVLEPEEIDRVQSMVGEVFEVDDIDERGCAWVTKWFKFSDGETVGHGLALSPGNMQVV